MIRWVAARARRLLLRVLGLGPPDNRPSAASPGPRVDDRGERFARDERRRKRRGRSRRRAYGRASPDSWARSSPNGSPGVACSLILRAAERAFGWRTLQR